MTCISRKIPCSSFVLDHRHPNPMTILQQGSPSFRPGHSSGGATKSLHEEKFHKQRVVTLCTRLVPPQAAQQHQGWKCLSRWKWGTFVHSSELQSCGKSCDALPVLRMHAVKGARKCRSTQSKMLLSISSDNPDAQTWILEDPVQQPEWLRSPTDLLVIWEEK